MANLQSLLRQVFGFIRRNPDKANQHLHSTSETIKKRTGHRYNQYIDKATGTVSKYLTKQGGRAGNGSSGDQAPQHRSEGSGSEPRPDGHDQRRDR